MSKNHRALVPTHFQNHGVWSWILGCSVKSCPDPHVVMWRNQRLSIFGVPWSPNFVLGLPPRDDFWEQSKWPWKMVHSTPCRNPCRLHIRLAFTYSVGPSSELGPAPPFPPMRELKVEWWRALSLVCEVPLTHWAISTKRLLGSRWGGLESQWAAECN